MSKYRLIILALLLGSSSFAAIHVWYDKHGNPQYSSRKPSAELSKDVTERISAVGNFIDVTDPGPIEFYQEPKRALPGHAKLNVQIKLFNYELSKKQNKRIRNHIEAIYDLYVSWFGWSATPSRPIKINIFGKYADFEQYQVEQGYKVKTNRSHYSRKRREVVVIGSEFKERTIRVLYHEASHAIMHMRTGKVPKWINEGLAEVFEWLVTDDKRNYQLGYSARNTEFLQLKSREGSLKKIEGYMQVTSSDWHYSDSRTEGTYYRVAWSLMRYLVSSSKGRNTLKKTMDDVMRNNKTSEGQLAELFDQHYTGGIRRLNYDWLIWLKKL